MTEQPARVTLKGFRSLEREGPLNWAQIVYWMANRLPGEGYNVNLTVPLPEGTALFDVQAALDQLVSRHESLRTTYSIGGDGEPVQRVWIPESVDVETCDSGAPDRTSREEGIRKHFFNIADETPFRSCAVLDGGSVKELWMSLTHIACDWKGLRLLREEIRETVQARLDGRPARLQPVGCQPIDLAVIQREQQKKSDQSVHYDFWTRQFESARTRIPFSRTPRRSTFYEVSFHSKDTAREIVAIANRHGTSPTNVYVAVVNALLRTYFSSDRMTSILYYSGRDIPSLETTVAHLSRELLLTVDIADGDTLLSVIRGVFTNCMRLYRHGRCDPMRVDDRKAEVERMKGARFRHGISINFMEGNGVSELRDQELDGGAAPTLVDDLDWYSDDGTMDCRLIGFLAQDGFAINAVANESVFPDRAMVALIDGMKTVLREMASDGDISMERIAEIQRRRESDGDTELLGTVVVDSDTTRNLLLQHPDVEAAAVFARPDADDGEQFVAYVTSSKPNLTCEDLRVHIMSKLDRWSYGACPGRFFICARRPEQEGEYSSWSAVPVVREGPGTDVPQRPSADRAEDALQRIVMEVNQLSQAPLWMTYNELGGQLVYAHAILDKLADAGFSGLTLDDLHRPVPLMALASALREVRPTGHRSELRTTDR